MQVPCNNTKNSTDMPFSVTQMPLLLLTAAASYLLQLLAVRLYSHLLHWAAGGGMVLWELSVGGVVEILLVNCGHPTRPLAILVQ